jgi:hypothetical protein
MVGLKSIYPVSPKVNRLRFNEPEAIVSGRAIRMTRRLRLISIAWREKRAPD